MSFEAWLTIRRRCKAEERPVECRSKEGEAMERSARKELEERGQRSASSQSEGIQQAVGHVFVGRKGSSSSQAVGK